MLQNIFPILYEHESKLLLSETNVNTILQWTIYLPVQSSEFPVGSVPTTALNLETAKAQVTALFPFPFREE